MGELPKNLTKLYYSIGEVSEILDLTNSLIRYWEGEFSELKPRKNRKGDRQFTVKDIETVFAIQQLVKERGFTIEGAKKELKENNAKRKKLIPIEKKLKALKKSMEKLRNHL